MEPSRYETALIVGAGSGLSASLARLFVREGMAVGLAARNPDKLGGLCDVTGAQAFACDATEPEQVERLFGAVESGIGVPDVVVYNAAARAGGPFVDLQPAQVQLALAAGAFGAFLVGQQAVRRMLPRGHGAVLFTGASASIKGYPQSAPFAMGKFALRGLAQSMARELAPPGHPCRPLRHRRCDPQSGAHGTARQAAIDARSRRNRAELSAYPPAAAQCLDMGAGGQALGREVLNPPAICAPPAGISAFRFTATAMSAKATRPGSSTGRR